MAQVRSWAGLDVHARSVLAVTTDAETGELRSQTVERRYREGGGVLLLAAGSDSRGV
jgi:hypothetical protein